MEEIEMKEIERQYELIEELERRLYSVINGMQEVSPELIEIIKMMYEELVDLCQSHNCAYESITTYIEGSTKELLQRIQNGYAIKRTDSRAEVAKYMIRKQQSQLESNEGEEIETLHLQKIEEEYQQLLDDNGLMAKSIIEDIITSLEDVKSRVIRILNAREEFSTQQKMEEVIHTFITDQINKKEGLVSAELQKDNQIFMDEMLKQYQFYCQQTAQIKQDNDKKDFKKRLCAGIPLRKQSEIVENFLNSGKSKDGKTLPGNIIE